jgi:tRNA threonylcarbamoyladenosine biosynthesis protein TsaB
MRILGVDTATSSASVALVENREIVAERIDARAALADPSSLMQPRTNHAETLLTLIDSLLDSAALSLNDVHGFAVSLGPGSFTGLRIGLSTVKGLAYGTPLPLVGIPTLLATATRAADHDGLVCALLDARKNEVYARLFYKSGGSLETLSEDFIAPVKAVCEKIRRLDAAACLFTGSGARLHRTLLANSFAGVAQFHLEETQPTLAATVARLGERRLERHEADDPGSLVPLYLRAADAETKPLVF